MAPKNESSVPDLDEILKALIGSSKVFNNFFLQKKPEKRTAPPEATVELCDQLVKSPCQLTTALRLQEGLSSDRELCTLSQGGDHLCWRLKSGLKHHYRTRINNKIVTITFVAPPSGPFALEQHQPGKSLFTDVIVAANLFGFCGNERDWVHWTHRCCTELSKPLSRVRAQSTLSARRSSFDIWSIRIGFCLIFYISDQLLHLITSAQRWSPRYITYNGKSQKKFEDKTNFSSFGLVWS